MKTYILRKYSSTASAFLSCAFLAACGGPAPDASTGSAAVPAPAQARRENVATVASADSANDILPQSLKDISDVTGLIANVYGAGQAASAVLNAFLQMAGLIGNEQEFWKSEFQELNQHLDAIGIALDWKIAETDRENAYADMTAAVSAAQEAQALGHPIQVGQAVDLSAHDKVNEAEKYVSFQRLFVESVTDGQSSDHIDWKWALPDNMRPSKANGEVDQFGQVYDWRLGIPHLLMLNALRIQVIAAADPNFLKDGVFKTELSTHRMALQDQLQRMKGGVRCAMRNDMNCQEDGGGNLQCLETYDTACADVFTGIAAANGTSAYDPVDPAWYQTNVVDVEEPLRRQVLVQLPLFDVQAMIDTLSLYESGAFDLTAQQGIIRLDANRSLCLNVRGKMGDTFDWRATVAKCDGSNGQKWKYDRSKQTIVNTVYNKCLDVFLGDITPGTMVSAADCNGSDAQKWTYDPTGQVLTNKLGNVLDVQWGIMQPGQPVWTWSRNDGPAQHWFADQVGIWHIPHL